MFRNVIAMALCPLVLACSSPPRNIVGVDNPAMPAASVEGTALQPVFIATTRKRSDDPDVLFTADRQATGLNFARVVVYIPPDHKVGTMRRPDSLPPDPRTDFVILEPVVFEGDQAFRDGVNRELKQRPRTETEILLFVHGYNTDLPAAIIRTAQFAHDSGFKGLPVVFAWPSKGETLEYVYDLNSALHARDGLILASTLLASTETHGINLVAHSMGNLLTVEAMRQAQLTGDFNSYGKTKAIVLASPDIDAELFAKQIQPFPEDERKFYILISQDDKALALSRRLAGDINRVGDESAEELAKLGVTVIDLTRIEDRNSLNHTKFANSPEIVQLIGSRLNEGDSLVERPAGGLLQTIPDAITILTSRGNKLIAFP